MITSTSRGARWPSLLALLRPSDIDACAGALKHLARIIARIRAAWPQVVILVRGDSGYCREHLMAWCEVHGVDYLFGLAKNSRSSNMWPAARSSGGRSPG